MRKRVFAHVYPLRPTQPVCFFPPLPFDVKRNGRLVGGDEDPEGFSPGFVRGQFDQHRFLLYLTFSSAKLAMLVVGNVPFALVGGVAALWIRGMNLNLSASIGFLALFGVAMLNGVVLISSINQLSKAGFASREAVLGGAQAPIAAGADDRLRRELRVHSDGGSNFYWSGGAASTGKCRDWRTVQLYAADSVSPACALRLGISQGTEVTVRRLEPHGRPDPRAECSP